MALKFQPYLQHPSLQLFEIDPPHYPTCSLDLTQHVATLSATVVRLTAIAPFQRRTAEAHEGAQ